MYLAKYLLSIGEFMNTENGEALFARAFSCVDETRREKARRMKPGKARAASLGAGLLLQCAVGEAAAAEKGVENELTSEYRRDEGTKAADAQGRQEEANDFNIRWYTVSQLLELLHDRPPLPLVYQYGKEGKPYFRDLPFFFNLSHSGDYVLCVISTEEIGTDIQRHCSRGDLPDRLAGRFFSERERTALKRAGEEREKLFFRLWARKEAYGKLTGKGVAGVLEVDMLTEISCADEMGAETPPEGQYASEAGEDMPPPGAEGRAVVRQTAEGVCFGEGRRSGAHFGERLVWDEYDGIEGYSIAICRYEGGKAADYPS